MAAATKSVLIVFSLLLLLSFSLAHRVPPSPKENEETHMGDPHEVVGIGSGNGGGNGGTEFGSRFGSESVSVFGAGGGGGSGSGSGSIGQGFGTGDEMGGCPMPNILTGALLPALLGGLQGGILGAQEGIPGAILGLGAQGGLQGGGSSWLRQIIPYLKGSHLDFLKTYGTSVCPAGCVPNPLPSQTAEQRGEPSKEAQKVVEPKKVTSAANEAQEPMPDDMLDLKNKPQSIRP
ncbi:hypothetical protein SLEP1_g26653 [Rubroshorea leprosula]|uniref:Uncharacterized protein n=1 Tax=Rubroshorea leprosula TaxID=152421 RepID=A0AAV5JQM1_9ROSI|nr:hypothetical protein SLEP1_g26653 [Rubroshorea leprosula]